VATPLELYDNPATRSVAGFVGESNLWEGTVISEDTVELPFGILKTEPHGLAAGRAVTVLVRPENVRIGAGGDGCNHFGGAVVRDRFFGASRRFDLVLGMSNCLKHDRPSQKSDLLRQREKPDRLCMGNTLRALTFFASLYLTIFERPVNFEFSTVRENPKPGGESNEEQDCSDSRRFIRADRTGGHGVRRSGTVSG
jgi:hypothetical protein